MINLLIENKEGIWQAFVETNIMMGLSIFISIIVSIPLGSLLFALSQDYLLKNRTLYQILSIGLNIIRSIPFLLFIFIMIPVNRAIWGTSFGVISSIIPLSLVTISIYARFVEQAYLSVDANIVDRSISMGASKYQIIRYFLLPSILNDLILSFTSTVISLLSYSTVMGVIGAGGLGDYAFREGYQQYNYQMMYLIIIIFVLYVFIIQSIGYFIAKKVNKYKES